MLPTTLNIDIYRGDDAIVTIIHVDDQGNPIDLSGFSASLEAREDINAPDAVINLTSQEDGGITLGEGGVITIAFLSALTTTLTPKAYVYDLQLMDTDNLITTIRRGTITVTGDITR